MLHLLLKGQHGAEGEGEVEAARELEQPEMEQAEAPSTELLAEFVLLW